MDEKPALFVETEVLRAKIKKATKLIETNSINRVNWSTELVALERKCIQHAWGKPSIDVKTSTVSRKCGLCGKEEASKVKADWSR